MAWTMPSGTATCLTSPSWSTDRSSEADGPPTLITQTAVTESSRSRASARCCCGRSPGGHRHQHLLPAAGTGPATALRARRFVPVRDDLSRARPPQAPSNDLPARALATAGRDLANVLFVGDDAECDYHGPRAEGMRAVVASPVPVVGVAEEDRIGHILELEPWLATTKTC